MTTIRDNLGARPRGYAVAEAVEQGIVSGVQTLQNWSKDDPDTWSDDILRLAGGGLSNIASVAEAPGIKQALQVLGAGGHYGGKLGRRIAGAVGVDERIGGAVFGLAGDALSGGLIAKGAKAAKLSKLAQKGTQGVLRRTAQPAFAKTDDTSDLAKYYRKGQDFMEQEFGAPTGTLRRELYTPEELAYLDDKIVMSGKGGKTWKAFPGEEGATYRSDAYKHWETHGTMRGYPKATVSGEDYMPRPGSTVDVKNRTGLKLDPVSRRKREGIKRLEPGKEDLPSIKRVFDAMADKNPKYNTATVQSYVETNRTVVKKVTDAITDFNDNVKATQKGWTNDDLLSLEHIFDVDFHTRLKAEIPSFSGRGANELPNLKAISYALNSRTGAINKKINIHDALIDSIKKGQGLPDYEKSIAQFIYEDIGTKVKNFNKADWKKLTGEVLSRPDSTIQDILVEMIKSKGKTFRKVKKSKPQWKGIANTAMRHMKEGGLPEARWRNANTQFTWSPKDLGGKGRGYIDIIKDATADDDIFALKRQFFKQIDELPSGTEWTLEADTAQKYRMYKRMFRDDPRIKPGGDKKLLEKRGIDHFVLKVP